MARLLECRRITGRHLLIPRPGAGLELALEGDESAAELEERLRERLGPLLREQGWPLQIHARPWTGGLSLAIAAPPDLLETACAVLDAALDPQLHSEIARCRRREEHPRLRALLEEADRRQLPVVVDEDGLTIGFGQQGQTWTLDRLPDALPAQVSAIPLVVVTGTNGKTTTTRLIARMAELAGHVAGHTSSEGIYLGRQAIETGDWSGPGAARRLLRDPRLSFAVLETARGGMMRRGLSVDHTDVAVVTNISDDHLHEWGIETTEEMAEVKLLVGRALRPAGHLICNGQQALDGPLAAPLSRLRAERPDVSVHLFLPPGSAAWADGELLRFGPRALPLSEVPIALGGAAPHNVENALCAGLAGLAAGLPWEAVAGGLRSLTLSPEDSRGRTNLFVREGATYVVDFAHNPAGLRHMAVLSARWPAQRRILLLGQSGDRTDELIEALTTEALRLLPDLILLKELPAHLRGRRKGEVPALIRAALARAGSAVPIVEVEDEVEGTREALRRHQPGDLCFLFVHEEYDRVVSLLRESGARPLQGG